jgi:hypothetical protein
LKSTPFSTISSTGAAPSRGSACQVRLFATSSNAARRFPGMSRLSSREVASRHLQQRAAGSTARRPKCRRPFHAAVHRPDDDRHPEAMEQRRLARRDRHRLMDDVDALLGDQPANQTPLFELRRESA